LAVQRKEDERGRLATTTAPFLISITVRADVIKGAKEVAAWARIRRRRVTASA
jgi:hypothetical protein